MSRQTVSAVIGSLLVAGFALGAVQGCGSSSSGAGSVMSLCMKGCAKESSLCGADAGETTADCMQGCVDTETTSTGGACSNQSAILMAGNACLTKTTCAELELCILTTVPQCAGGTGGSTGTGTGGSTGAGASGTGTGGTPGIGGATGTGGTTGTGGGSGTAACAVCDKAQTCCIAAAPTIGLTTADCTFSAATCNSVGASSSSYASSCQTILTEGAALSVAACK